MPETSLKEYPRGARIIDVPKPVVQEINVPEARIIDWKKTAEKHEAR